MILGCGRRLAVLCALPLLLGPFGCGQRAGDEQFIPPNETARQALETVLTNLERGRPADAGTTSPVIHLVDSQLKPGQKLARHEIVKEESEDGHTVFSVRLYLKGAKREQVARYVVIGRDPLWVYRDEDFHSAGGM
jgi:hypothetical protein